MLTNDKITLVMAMLVYFNKTIVKTKKMFAHLFCGLFEFFYLNAFIRMLDLNLGQKSQCSTCYAWCLVFSLSTEYQRRHIIYKGILSILERQLPLRQVMTSTCNCR